ncbi:MAG: hypothetical protein ACTH31_08905 [Pseudoclavibacter sp.]
MTTTSQPAIDVDYITEVAADVARIDQLVAELGEQRAAHLAILEQAHEAGIIKPGKNPLTGTVVTVRAGQKRLDTKRLESTYPAQAHPGLYALKLDTKAVRAAIAPNALSAFETQGTPSISVAAA